MSRSKPLLFVPGSATSFKLQRPFAEYCLAQQRPIAFLYDGPPDDLFEAMTADVASLGVPFLALDTLIEEGERKAGPWPWSRPAGGSGPFEDIRKRLPSPKLTIFFELMLRRRDAAERALKQIDPAAVIVGEDGIGGPAAIQAAARSRKVPVIDLPYGYGNQRDFEISLEAKAARGDLVQADGPEGAAIRELAPQWVKSGAFAGALMFPPELIIAREATGMSLRDAWIVHGGHADRLLVESEQMLAFYRSEGIPESKLALTGSPYCDIMRQGLDADPDAKAALRQPRRIDPRETRILVSWPPSYHEERGSKSEFPTYLEMTEAVLGWLSRLPNCRLTVSLHPAVSPADRKAIGGFGVDLTDEYVLRLIPRHDIYVSYFSSTIRWAIAAGKPVINYDAYKLGLDVYAAAPGVVTSDCFEHLKQKMASLVTPSDADFEALAAQQVGVAPQWGILDGQCMPRMLAEIDARARS